MRHTLVQFTGRATLSPRSSLPSRLRSRRYQSSGSPQKQEPISDKNKLSPSNAQNSPSPSAPAVPGPRSLRQIISDGPLGRLGRSYSRVQERRPYATQLWSSVIVYLCGDLSAQFLFPSQNTSVQNKDSQGSQSAEKDGDAATSQGSYDPWRTLRHLVVGSGSSIPSYTWFMFLHHNFNFASKFLSILTKVVVQQAVFTPVFNTYFFSVHSLLSGASLEETWERLKKALPVSITNSAKLWPAVTAFSFMYVPPQFRNIFSGVIAVGWQTYLSWLNQKAAREVEAAELAEAEISRVGLDTSGATMKA
ncbi:Mpv17/PMP22 family protein [Aspergillus affinis]|uniref:Mpv17/PMP22 family protein n=1 Tax=Aspergillus affinis TaxID=1070780 RepID=UPI0022FE5C46|nr:uncharacterized protein KD926_007647 [Aspergillus affinis]KAI9040839.1 hypothetical protein KD926_007647 [Aspergillus affinis]